MQRIAKICLLGLALAVVSSQAQAGSTLGYATTISDATMFRGADFGAKVNACLKAVEQIGGGVCDARGFGSRNSSSGNIVVGDGVHGTTLMLPAGTITFASGSGLIYHRLAQIIGEGAAISQLSCDSSSVSACVMNYDESRSGSAVAGVRLEHFSITGTGYPRSGSSGLMLGNGSDVLEGRFEDLWIRGFDVGTSVSGPGGCTCYNSLKDIVSMGLSYGVKIFNGGPYVFGVNSNSWYGGTAFGNVGLYASGDSGNRFYGIDIEVSPECGIDLEGAGDSVISPYEEASGPDQINGERNMIIGPLPIPYTPASLCSTCLVLGPGVALGLK